MTDHPLFTQPALREFTHNVLERTERLVGMERDAFNYSLRQHEDLATLLGGLRLETNPLPDIFFNQLSFQYKLQKDRIDGVWDNLFPELEGWTPWQYLEDDLFPVLRKLKVSLPSGPSSPDNPPDWFIDGLLGSKTQSISFLQFEPGLYPNWFSKRVCPYLDCVDRSQLLPPGPQSHKPRLAVGRTSMRILQYAWTNISDYKNFQSTGMRSCQVVIRCDPCAFLHMGTFSCDKNSCMRPEGGERRRNPLSLVFSPNTFLLLIRKTEGPLSIYIRAIGQVHFSPGGSIHQVILSNIYRRGPFSNLTRECLKEYLALCLLSTPLGIPNHTTHSSYYDKFDSDLFYPNGDSFCICDRNINKDFLSGFKIFVPPKYVGACLAGTSDDDDEGIVYCVECNGRICEGEVCIQEGNAYCEGCFDERFIYSDAEHRYIDRDNAINTYDGDYCHEDNATPFSDLSSPTWTQEFFHVDDGNVESVTIDGVTHYFHKDDPVLAKYQEAAE